MAAKNAKKMSAASKETEHRDDVTVKQPQAMKQSDNYHDTRTQTTNKTQIKKSPVKLDDSVSVDVKSNVYGELIYRNHRTGDKTKWSEFGDVQTLTVGDLRAMKGTQRSFFEKQWIIIMGIAEDGYDDITQEELYRSLLLSQYYNDTVDNIDLDRIFTLPPADIKAAIAKMPDGVKLNLLVAANTNIANGTLDSMKTIQAIEEGLCCELNKR